MWKMGFSETCYILLLVFNLQLVICCDLGEYNFQDHCCSMCPPGTHVSKHCTLLLGTVCIPCARGAYMDHPNGLDKCLKCKYCDAELGLDTVRECSGIQDTVCDCKEGYFCMAKTNDRCQRCTKYITQFLNESGADKGDPKEHEVNPTTQSVLTQGNFKFMEKNDTQNPSQPGNKTLRRKTGPKPETSDKLWKWESAPETTTGKSKVAHGQDSVSMRKTLMSLMQTIDQALPKESLKLQEAGIKAITDLQNSMQINLASMQNVMQIGLVDIQNTIQSSMAGLQDALKTGMADMKSALQTGMVGIQEALISGMADIKGIKIGLSQTDNTLKQMQANLQSNLVLMAKQFGSLVNTLTKFASNQTISFIQFKDIICNPSNNAEAVQPQVTIKQP